MSGAKQGKVILISGPARSGKTTMASLIAKNEHWVMISEDEAWAKMKEGHPLGESRTPEEEKIVQAVTLDKIVTEVAKDKNVVLEFILYLNPPTPVIFYREELLAKNIEVVTRLLKASETEIWHRKVKRGYEWDKDEARQKRYVNQQLSCLSAAYLDEKWLIDNTHQDAETVYREHFAQFI